MLRRSAYFQSPKRRTAAIISTLAGMVMLALAAPAEATAATGEPGFLCGVTGGTSTLRATTPRRDSDAICAVVFLPDLLGRRASSS
ncbi:MAG: hypothetical protein QOI89_3685 [Solirubrobacteraceae bacterium]|jgi:hypothetical protein|nr:hypothetical protein [Solirubrobacteraceae bacterium]